MSERMDLIISAVIMFLGGFSIFLLLILRTGGL